LLADQFGTRHAGVRAAHRVLLVGGGGIALKANQFGTRSAVVDSGGP